MVSVGNVETGSDARRIDTARLKTELHSLGYACGLNYVRSGRGGWDVWVEANDNIADEAEAKTLACPTVQAQAERLRVQIR